MRYKIGLLFALLLAMVSPSQAQLIREELIPASITRDAEIIPTGTTNGICLTSTPGPTFNIALCSTVDLTAKTVLYKIPEYAFASIPAGTPLVVVTNSASSAVCDGSGATKVVCWWNGTAWTPLGSGSGSGTIAGVTAGSGLTGGGTSGTVTLNVGVTSPLTVSVDSIQCPTCTTNASGLTANSPVIGAGANAVAVGTSSGNTTQFATVTGSKTTGMQLAFDASGNVIASGSGVGGGLSGLTVGNLHKAATTSSFGPSQVTEDADSVNIGFPVEIGNVATNSLAIDTSGITGAKTWTAPNVSDTFIFRADPAILTNKSISGSTNTLTNLPVSSVVAALKTKSITFVIGRDTGSPLVDTDDQPTVWRNNIAAMTITEVWAESNAGTPSINLQRDDGTPADICSSNLTATTSGATCTISSVEDNLALGDKIDFTMVTAGGVAARVTIGIKAVLD